MANLASVVSKQVISAINTKHSVIKQVTDQRKEKARQRTLLGLRQAVELALSELIKMEIIASDVLSNPHSVTSISIRSSASTSRTMRWR